MHFGQVAFELTDCDASFTLTQSLQQEAVDCEVPNIFFTLTPTCHQFPRYVPGGAGTVRSNGSASGAEGGTIS